MEILWGRERTAPRLRGVKGTPGTLSQLLHILLEGKIKPSVLQSKRHFSLGCRLTHSMPERQQVGHRA